MKVFAAHGRTGSAFYRILLPLGKLGEQSGFDVTLRSGYQPISDTDFAGSDIIVGQRISNPVIWDHAGSVSGLVYEIDDDVFSIRPENKFAYADYQRPEMRDGTARCITRSDLVTVPTEPLAEVMHQFNKNVVVLPNRVPDWVLGLSKANRRRPCLGWAGGAAHARNAESIAVPVRRFLKRAPDWYLRLVGTDYRPLFGHDRCEFTPWIDITGRPTEYYLALDFDIGLAPMLDNQFNRCKSPLRALECAARGIPVIASNVTPYREFIDDGVTGFLVRREHEWLKRVDELAADEGLRTRMGTAAREAARAWTVGTGWRLWASAYESVA